LQLISFARIFALLSAGNSNAAKMAMMAITTKSSISVNARETGRIFVDNDIALV